MFPKTPPAADLSGGVTGFPEAVCIVRMADLGERKDENGLSSARETVWRQVSMSTYQVSTVASVGTCV